MSHCVSCWKANIVNVCGLKRDVLSITKRLSRFTHSCKLTSFTQHWRQSTQSLRITRASSRRSYTTRVTSRPCPKYTHGRLYNAYDKIQRRLDSTHDFILGPRARTHITRASKQASVYTYKSVFSEIVNEFRLRYS